MQHPIAVYTAGTDIEAHTIRQMLLTEGIEAAVIEDLSRAGVWELGLLPQFHRPKIWVDRADEDRARALLAEYERRRIANAEPREEGPPVHVVCEECRKTTTFAGSRRGHVENCSHCGAYVDVEDDPGFDDWNVPSNDEPK